MKLHTLALTALLAGVSVAAQAHEHDGERYDHGADRGYDNRGDHDRYYDQDRYDHDRYEHDRYDRDGRDGRHWGWRAYEQPVWRRPVAVEPRVYYAPPVYYYSPPAYRPPVVYESPPPVEYYPSYPIGGLSLSVTLPLR